MNVADQEQFFTGVDASADPALLRPGFVSEAENRRFVKGIAMPRKGAVVMCWANKQAEYFDCNTQYTAGQYVRYSGLKITNGTLGMVNHLECETGVVPTATSGPASNNKKVNANDAEPAGPYFKALVSTSDNAPVETYNDGSGLITVDTTWEGQGTLYLKYPGTIYGASNFETPNGVEHLVIATSQGIFVTSPDSASEEVKVNNLLYGHSSYPAITGDSKVRFVQCFNNLIMFRGDLHAPLVLTENLTNGFN